MIKYKPDTVQVVFNEIPDYVSLAIEITNCPGMCEGCHSPWLREDIGEELTKDRLFQLIDENPGINCVVFMGEGKDPSALQSLALEIRYFYDNIKVALYSGRPEVEDYYAMCFDFIKVGPYIEKYGPLNKETTNQRLYEIIRKWDGDDVDIQREDITYKFWRK